MITFVQHYLGATLVFLQSDGQIAPDQFQSGTSLLWLFMQTMFALGFVCLLAYVGLRVVLPRVKLTGGGKSMVRIIDRTALDPRRSLYVVEVAGRWLLIGASEGGLQLIGELDAATAEREAEAMKAVARGANARATFSQATTTARTAFADVLARMAHKR